MNEVIGKKQRQFTEFNSDNSLSTILIDWLTAL